MTQIFDTLNQNGAVIGLAGIFIGILATVLVAYIFSSRARLAAQVNSLQIVGPNAVMPPELEFVYRGTRVPKVTLSRVALWNIGNMTLRGDQIVTADPLRIATSDTSQVLELTILNRTRNVNGFSCGPGSSENEINCSFDYLDPGDGALLQIIHTGNDKVAVMGTLRGVRQKIKVVGVPKQIETKQKPTTGSPVSIKIAAIIVTLFGVLLLLDAIPAVVGQAPLLVRDLEKGHPGIVLGPVCMVLGGLLLYAARLMPPKELSTQITTIEAKKPLWSFVSHLFRKNQ